MGKRFRLIVRYRGSQGVKETLYSGKTLPVPDQAGLAEKSSQVRLYMHTWSWLYIGRPIIVIVYMTGTALVVGLFPFRLLILTDSPESCRSAVA